MRWTIPNILTVGRLFLVPVFVSCFFFKWYAAAFFAFVIASFTDLIDGAIARYFKQHTQFGAILDPIADKCLMLGAFSCLAYINSVPMWFLVIIIIRDVMIMGGVGLLKVLKIDVEYKPFWSSKVTTLLQIILGTLALGSLWSPAFSFGAYPITDLVEGIMYITAIMLIITALQYLQKGLEILKDRYSV